ncbi:MAG: transketolase C-terminal domain-containing protein [Actinomycetota bacterium]|nr:transketolase C-terminal domain-containing protein [Actinomycetota bacterium]
MREIRYLKAVSETIEAEMEKDPSIFYMGEDVRYALKGIPRGFIDKFGPERIIDTPISEAGFVGIATGAAVQGMRPIVEFQISMFCFLAYDEIVNQAQKMYYMSGAQMKVPVTYIVPLNFGSIAGQHSDSPHSFMMHGLIKTIMPSNGYDAKGLVLSAIRDDDPVIVFLPAGITGRKGEVPEEQYTIPIGVGEIKREGSDITVVATGRLVPKALEAAENLAKEGISLEVYDPRTLFPFDKPLLKKSVQKTGKAIIMDDSTRTCGFAAEVAAFLSDECFATLKAPVKRITRADVPVPFSLALEKLVVPEGVKELTEAVYDILKK